MPSLSPPTWRNGDPVWVALVAIGTVFGAQLLRVMAPSVGWYLADTVDLPSLQLLPYAFAPFVAAFLAPVLALVVGRRQVLVAAGIGLGLARAAEQLIGEPAIDLWLALGGTACFIGFLAMLPARRLAIGVLVGLALDTAVKGLAGTLDLSWYGAWPIVVVGPAAVVFLFLLLRAPFEPDTHGGTLGWLAVGPLLFLHLLLFQNQGLMGTLTGWSPGLALLVISIGNVLAIGAAVIGGRVPAVLSALLLLPAVLLVGGRSPGYAAAAIIAIGASGLLLAAVDERIGRGGGWGMVIGWVIVGVLLFAYYGALDIRLPFPRAWVPVAAVAVVLIGSGAALLGRLGAARAPRTWQRALLGVALLIAPVATIGFEVAAAEPDPPGGFPIRVMDYNIHSGYGKAGRQNVAEIARAIAEQDADVVGLQEVSRGWLMNGSTDLVTQLSRRLGMPYTAFYGTADALWGNAVLSRYPIVKVETGPLPSMESLIPRGYLIVTLDVAGEELTVIDTHLAHLRDPEVNAVDPQRDLEELHLAQLGPILKAWGDRPRTVLMGDLNARPGWAEIQLLLDAGFVDAWDAGAGEGYTSDAADPFQRIDWVFHTPDLVASNASVPVTLASDHLPIAVTIEPAR